jgi:hypothetical protein
MSKPNSILGYFKKVDTPDKKLQPISNNVENSASKTQTPNKKLIKDESRTIVNKLLQNFSSFFSNLNLSIFFFKEKSVKRAIDKSESPKITKRRRLMVLDSDDSNGSLTLLNRIS